MHMVTCTVTDGSAYDWLWSVYSIRSSSIQSFSNIHIHSSIYQIIHVVAAVGGVIICITPHTEESESDEPKMKMKEKEKSNKDETMSMIELILREREKKKKRWKRKIDRSKFTL